MQRGEQKHQRRGQSRRRAGTCKADRARGQAPAPHRARNAIITPQTRNPARLPSRRSVHIRPMKPPPTATLKRGCRDRAVRTRRPRAARAVRPCREP
jgi:hypothetical protein